MNDAVYDGARNVDRFTDSAIQAIDLTKTFGARSAVKNASFDLPKGAYLTVFGPNGAGKTTLLRMLALLAKPSSGSIRINGLDPKECPDDIRCQIGMISHNSMLYPDLTAEENLVFYGKLYGVDNVRERALELLEDVGLKHRRCDKVRTFSRGMTQRVAIARALMNDPEIILLDEPYSGLDLHAVESFDQMIERIRDRRTFVTVSHDLEKGLSLASHVLIMSSGREVLFSSLDEISQDKVREEYVSVISGSAA